MGLLDTAKNILAMVKKYNDIELNQQIIDLTQQSLDLINENVRLTQENEELKNANDLENKIQRHDKPFVTISDDSESVKYCATCWGKEKHLIQLQQRYYSGGDCLECNICKLRFRI
ncbi:hypothetical protein [Ruminococcus sp.]|jgi:regulator of replication initiation timing|uniref:hypothetical protein n=1 Tax=Ruminococcus sp. TaxID=41978 RepID=UPI0025E7CD36|nr:hypothetical protein [Ruminococcus sp.]